MPMLSERKAAELFGFTDSVKGTKKEQTSDDIGFTVDGSS